MNKETISYGIITLFLLTVIVVSSIVFYQFNLPNNGNLNETTLKEWSAYPGNVKGVISSHFFHSNTAHLLENLFALTLLVFIALSIENKVPEIRSINAIKYIALPIIGVSLFQVLLLAYLNSINSQFNRYPVGASLVGFYLLGFFLMLLIPLILHYLKNVKNLANLRHKINTRNVLRFILGLLFIYSALSNFTSFQNLLSQNIDEQLKSLAHFIALSAGILMAIFWKQKDKYLTNSSTLPATINS